MKRHLVLFAKAPVLGRVKTRLAAGIGAVSAQRFYRRTLAELVRRVGRDRSWGTVLAVSPDRAARQRRLWPGNIRRVPQGGGDLGARMGRVFRDWPPGPVVIIGADIPEIQTRHIRQAFRALGTADAVFGPAADGGYWLVGVRPRASLSRLFDNVRWSTPHALADTRRNLHGRAVALLETLDDIDDMPAYLRWRQRTAATGQVDPAQSIRQVGSA